MQYRRELDGLRAVAVVPVILFHADLAYITGGYAGVDIFFVISGFLITSIILAAKEEDGFSLAAFYERRARRILPALVVVMVSCAPAAWLWMSPPDLRQFGQSVVAVSAFVSNVFFWRRTDYFAPAAEELPLLHTWSLGVEEQFYVVFPLFLGVCWRFWRHRLLLPLSVVALASLALSEWGWRSAPVGNFFSSPARAWELLLGAMVACAEAKRPLQARYGVRFNQAASACGLLLVLLSFFAYDRGTPFPSVYALAPTLGTALLIGFAGPSTFAGRLLSQPPLVGIGLISYSAYLWHQPVFAFARRLSLRELSPAVSVALAAATLGLAFLTWRYVETPFRDRRRVSRRTLVGAAGLATACLIGGGLFVGYTKNVSSRVGLPAELLASLEDLPRRAECFSPVLNGTAEADWTCPVAPGASAPPSFLVSGDSHAFSLLPAFEAIARRHGLQGTFAGARACAPLLGVVVVRENGDHDECTELNARVLGYVARHGIRDVFLVARWSAYADGDYGTAPELRDPTQRSGPALESARQAFAAGVERTLEAYARLGVRVHVVEQVPTQRYDARKLYFVGALRGRGFEFVEENAVTEREHHELQSYVSSVFDRFRSDGRVAFIDLSGGLCRDGVCPVGTAERSYYRDDDHLSSVGALLVSDRLEGPLAALGTAGAQ